MSFSGFSWSFCWQSRAYAVSGGQHPLRLKKCRVENLGIQECRVSCLRILGLREFRVDGVWGLGFRTYRVYGVFDVGFWGLGFEGVSGSGFRGFGTYRVLEFFSKEFSTSGLGSLVLKV